VRNGKDGTCLKFGDFRPKDEPRFFWEWTQAIFVDGGVIFDEPQERSPYRDGSLRAARLGKDRANRCVSSKERCTGQSI
jgi:hypothetical protein